MSKERNWMATGAYVLVTAARNEERYIKGTLESVVSQAVQPVRWVVVSDASTDRTDAIVDEYARKHSFIRLLRLAKDHPRNFASQVNAIAAGVKLLESESYHFIGNLDADVSFAPDYFQKLIEKFERYPELGLAGGVLREESGSELKPSPGEYSRSVPHAVQLFRRACFEDIGGYPPLPYGGPDTYAEVAARMKQWSVQVFPDLIVAHHRAVGSAGGLLRGRFRQGMMDHSLGYLPSLELVKCGRRIREKPALIGCLARLSGFLWAYARIGSRPVPEEFVRFLRSEQRRRIRALFSGRGSHVGG
jgi:glycosyltransferase involved in cell wall biosynthesis